MLVDAHDFEDLLASRRHLQLDHFGVHSSLVRREGGASSRYIIPVRTNELPDGISLRPLAILIGDIVSYSRLVEEDGVGTVLQIRAMRRSILSPLARRYRACTCRGFGGDGALMGFADAASSIRCALELQRELATVCKQIPRHRRIRLRLGLSFGMGLLVDGTVYGTPVNVAARLQALAAPGCICISGDLVAAVRDSLRLELKDMGEHRLKNIKGPTEVYRLVAVGSE